MRLVRRQHPQSAHTRLNARSSSAHRRRSALRVSYVHTAPLPDDQITTIDGVPVTSLARTVLDLCRTVPIEQAVAAGDRALAYGLVVAVLDAQLAEMSRWPGTRQARRAIALFDPRSESPGESVSRGRLHEDGLPPPELQQKYLRRVWEVCRPCRLLLDGAANDRRIRREDQVRTPAEARTVAGRSDLRREGPGGRAPRPGVADCPLVVGGPISVGCRSRSSAASLRKVGLLITS
jgi:hypothetical protein